MFILLFYTSRKFDIPVQTTSLLTLDDILFKQMRFHILVSVYSLSIYEIKMVVGSLLFNADNRQL